jgi:hypothetical protein
VYGRKHILWYTWYMGKRAPIYRAGRASACSTVPHSSLLETVVLVQNDVFRDNVPSFENLINFFFNEVHI